VAPFWRCSRKAPSIQIKNVPPEVHEALQRRARNAGKSMQEFLLDELKLISRQEAVDEIFEAGRNSGIGFQRGYIAELIREERDARDRG